ncbi:MAG: hypothetical protein LAT77_10515 [Aliidiomarina sp.]|uniref:hypothetical protein n=1 Tax=Aliidiomarina sp. TaxID=1872439 RepID=UPI0025C6D10E|nr:hypothetical protein [Aliidiomarina sp.]MCH8502328.1 hypothetical protein [Aliidiomarina sp.]
MIALTDIPVLCLTLPNARERQKLVKKEFVRHQFKHYQFFPGVDAHSVKVRQAFENSRVIPFPGCFRCGQGDCGKDCNNILIPQQVAVVLSFQALLRQVANGPHELMFVCEDDIVIADYASDVFSHQAVQSLLQNALEDPERPFLLRLGSPKVPGYFSNMGDLPDVRLDNEVRMSNYAFVVNRKMAHIATTRLEHINHTADVILHSDLADAGSCFSLTPQIVHDRSWATGELMSGIHPKRKNVDYALKVYGAESLEYKQAALSLKTHRKKARETEFAFIGSPRCGSHYLSELLIENGVDVGHEKLGNAGICAWQYAVYSESHPYIADLLASNSFFLYPKKYFLYVRNPMRAVPSLITENQQAPLSYGYRRDRILEVLGINLDSFSCEIERAARAYIHWYELALRNTISGIVRIEHAVEDLNGMRVFGEVREFTISDKKSGKGKPYLGVAHENPDLPEDWVQTLATDTRVRLLMMARQFGYTVE